MRQFFVEQRPEVGDLVGLSKEDDRHLRRVLRGQKGDEVRIVSHKQAFLGCLEEDGIRIQKNLDEHPSNHTIHLAMGLIKGPKLEEVIKHGTEVGVNEFHLLNLQYSVVNYQGKEKKKLEKLEKIAEEAAKQSNGLMIPKIHEPTSLSDFLRDYATQLPLILCNEKESATPLLTLLEEDLPSEVALMIGPEGGFHPDELKEILSCGAKSVHLGHSILRAETAAVVAAYSLRQILEREEE